MAFVNAINGERAARGVAPLTVDVRLSNIASWWSPQMASAGRISHNLNLANMLPAGWTRAGENVGVGPSEPALENAFVNSPEHLANMVDPSFTTIGVGVVWTGSTMWVTEDFMAGVAAVSPPPPAVTWTGWSGQVPPAPSGVRGAPAVATWGAGRFDQFVRGADNHLWHLWSNDGGATFQGWQDLGAPAGGLGSSPAAVSWGPGRIDVFAKGADNALWHLWYDGASWHGWESFGGTLSSAPTVSSWSPGRLDVFATGTDRATWHMWWGFGAWHQWESRGGVGAYAPAATSWGVNRIDLFTVGSDGKLWHSFWMGAGWTPWSNEVGGTWASSPSVASWAPGRVDLFIPSTSSGEPLGHVWYSAGWNVESMAGSVTGADTTSWGPNRLDTFDTGADGNIYHDAYPGS